MEKRKAEDVRVKYKLFNLLVDFPFLRIYEMLRMGERRTYLLIDYDPSEDSYGLKEEMNLWRKYHGIFSPPLLEVWEDGAVFSQVVRKQPGLHWLELKEGPDAPQSRLLSQVPALAKFFETLYEFQINVFNCEDLSLRLYCDFEGKLVILPAALYHLEHRDKPPTESLRRNPSSQPVSSYTCALGALLFYALTDAVPTEGQISEEVKEALPEPLIQFLDFLLTGKADTFQSLREKFQKLPVDKTASPPAAVQPEGAPETPLQAAPLPAAAPQPALRKTFPARLLALAGTAILLLRFIAFLVFHALSYYAGMIRKGIRWLARLQWKDIVEIMREAPRRLREDFLRLGYYLGRAESVKEADLINFTRYFSIMLGAGIPLTRCLEILLRQTASPPLKNALEKITEAVVGTGSPLSKAMALSPRVFSDIYVNTVAVGETTGAIDKAFDQILNYLESSSSLNKKIKRALIYPIIIATAALAFFGFFVYILLPRFMEMFQQMRVTLPLPTRILIGIVNFFHSPKTVFYTALACLAALFPLRAYFRTAFGKKGFDEMKLRLPLIGPLYKKILLARFSSTLAVLFGCGVPMLQALETTGKAAGNEYLRETLNYTMEAARAGSPLHVIMAEQGFFPKLLLSMLKVGEETAQLGPMLGKVHDIYMEDITEALVKFLALLEPLLMATMGICVGFVLLAVFLPIYTLVSSIR